LQLKKKRKHVKWTTEEDATVLKMRDEDGCSWEEICEELSHRTQGGSRRTTIPSERVLVKPMYQVANSRRDGEAGPGSKREAGL